jgi:hypothetical protein
VNSTRIFALFLAGGALLAAGVSLAVDHEPAGGYLIGAGAGVTVVALWAGLRPGGQQVLAPRGLAIPRGLLASPIVVGPALLLALISIAALGDAIAAGPVVVAGCLLAAGLAWRAWRR